MSNTSIITAARNSAQTIAACLESIQGQSILPEHIIIDGVSTDDTLKIIRQNQFERKKNNIRLISEPDKGIYDAMNKGVQMAKGEIIGILNADDFYASSDVLAQVAAVFEDEDVDSCYGDLVYVDAKDISRIVRWWRSGAYHPDKFRWGWMPPHPAFFVRRRIYEKYGLFNLSLGSAADYELMLRFLFKYRISTVYIPEVLVRMRTGGVSNSSIKNRIRANRMDHMAWQINGLKTYPWTLSLKPLRKISQYFSAPCRP